MKSFKSSIILGAAFLCAFVFMRSSCKKCSDPAIVINPASATASKAPGDKINLDIIVTGTDANIKSIVVTKTLIGSTTTFISVTGIGSMNKTVTMVDSVPTDISYFDVITSKRTATSDCKSGNSKEETYTVTVNPSSTILDPLFFEVKNSFSPNIYSRFSTNSFNSSDNASWDLQKRVPHYAVDANADKDICDSCIVKDPYTANVRWGSRNGSKFVKANTLNYDNATAKSIIDAYKAGVPSDLVTYTANDIIIVNIKNKNRFAVITIRSIVEDGFSTSYEDYTFFKYKLAQ